MKFAARLGRFLDDGLDEMADNTEQGLLQRCLVMAAVAACSLPMVSWRVSAAWLLAMSAIEAWAVLGGGRVFRDNPHGPAARLHHLGTVVAVSCGWMVLGWLLWTSGTTVGALAGAVLWLSVIFFGQNYGHVSPVGLAVGGGAPTLFMFTAVALSHNPFGRPIWPAAMMMVLAVAFSTDGAVRMLLERRQFAKVRARQLESEARYRMLADNATDIIGLTRVGGERLYITPSIDALGYTPDEFTALSNYDHVHPDDREAILGRLKALSERGGRDTMEYRVLHRNGHPIWVETSATILPKDDLGATKMVTVSRVIDARKAMERDLLEALQKAEQAAAAKSDFLANMTHELRTPLNAIIGFSGLLARSRSLSKADARHAALIEDASATLLEIVNSVLDFSKLEAGAAELDPQPFDPVAEADAAVALISDQARIKELVVQVTASGARGGLMGDAPRLRQVLLNFLSNAVKFTASGRIDVRIRRRTIRSGVQRVRFEVADTGIGVAPAQLAMVFERFTQADVSVSRSFGGTGLGLAICKRIIELMDGEIGAESLPGKGSTFWFEVTLPIARLKAVKAVAAEVVDAPARPLRLLLAEDVAANRELMQALLSPFDVHIDMAVNGVEAVEAAHHGAYDLILMDVQMPVMDGLAAAERIRADEQSLSRRTPIVAMTANVLPEQVEKCLASGMDSHLGKPISPAALLQTIARWTSGAADEDRKDVRRAV